MLNWKCKQELERTSELKEHGTLNTNCSVSRLDGKGKEGMFQVYVCVTCVWMAAEGGTDRGWNLGERGQGGYERWEKKGWEVEQKIKCSLI